jgi:hypothetical protein
MNNSFIANENASLPEDEKLDNTSVLRARETDLNAIIEAILRLSANPDWLTLKDLIFDGVVDSLKKQRDSEVEKKPLNGPMIHSLNGQIAWAKKYSDILGLAHIYKLELQNVRKVLNARSSNKAD